MSNDSLTKKDIITASYCLSFSYDLTTRQNIKHEFISLSRLREVLKEHKDFIWERNMLDLNNDFCEGYRTAQHEIHNNLWKLFGEVLE